MTKKIFKIVGVLFLFAIISIIVFLVFRKNNVVSYQTAVEQNKIANSHFYTWNGLQCHYTLSGNGKDTIVMIHGLGGSFNNFEKVVDLLKNDYTIYCFDLPAFGLSEVPNLKIDNNKILDFYRQFMDESFTQLQLNSFHIWGNSLGGWMAWDYSGRNIEHIKSLTLLNAAGFGMEKAKSKATAWMTNPIAKIFLKKGIPFSKAKENAERCFYDESKVKNKKVYVNYVMNNKENTLDWMIKMALSNVVPDTTLLTKITKPSLILWGEQDEIVSVENAYHFKKNLPNDTMVIINHCGHIPMIEYPEKTIEIWETFKNNFAKEKTPITHESN